MTVRGWSVSAAAKPSISTPPKANMMKAKAITRPDRPLGKKPPCVHRLRTVCSGRSALNSKYTPAAIMASTAAILISANQNSNSP